MLKNRQQIKIVKKKKKKNEEKIKKKYFFYFPNVNKNIQYKIILIVILL